MQSENKIAPEPPENVSSRAHYQTWGKTFKCRHGEDKHGLKSTNKIEWLCDKDFIDFCREMKIERMDPHFAISLILLYLEKKEKND